MEEFAALLASGRTATERWVRAHVSNPQDAEDILQETYLAAYQGFGRLRNREAFLPWLLGIARRKYADWYRAKSRRAEVLMDALPDRAAEDGKKDQKNFRNPLPPPQEPRINK